MLLILLFVIPANDGWNTVEITLFGNIKHCTHKKTWMTTTICTKLLTALCASNIVQGKKVWLFMKTSATHLQDTSFLQNIPPNWASVMPSTSTGHG